MIHIYQRHCITSSNSDHKKRPNWFNKLDSFQFLYKSLTGDVTLTCLLDGNKEKHFLGDPEVVPPNVKVIEFEGGTENASFLYTLDYILEQNHNDEDIIYILEDDYVHRRGWCGIMREGFSQMNVDYITLYDHPDKYTTMYSGIQVVIYPTKNVHWRITPSTTNTFACKFKTLKKHKDIHRKHSLNDLGYTQDHAKFTDLWKQGSNLISPIPGYSTHCEPQFLSPSINWEEELNILARINSEFIPI